MIPKYIDVHSHINFKVFDEDREEVIKRALDNDTWVINVGTQIDTSKRAVEIASQYEEGVYAIIGLHPIHTGASYHDEQELGKGGEEFTSRGEVFNKDAYRELLKNKKVVGVGECGLDYYNSTGEFMEKQKRAFIEQIELAEEFKKPIMIHCRDGQKSGTGKAFDDLIEILKSSNFSLPFVSHSFVRDIKLAEKLLALGSYFSFNGIATFPKTDDYVEVIKYIPLERILSETDAPYLSPVPHRGSRNESAYVSEVVKKIAEIKGLPLETVACALVTNARRIFDI